jgi:acyl-CoA thioesterase-1
MRFARLRLSVVTFSFILALGCSTTPNRQTAGTGGTTGAGSGGTNGAGGGAGNGASCAITPGMAIAALRPNPLVSRHKTTFSLPLGGAAVVDGAYHNGGWSAGTPTAGAPAWVAIKIVDSGAGGAGGIGGGGAGTTGNSGSAGAGGAGGAVTVGIGGSGILGIGGAGGFGGAGGVGGGAAGGSTTMAARPTRVLVSWDDGGTYNYQDPDGTTVYGFPDSYSLQVSADSTNGADGTWTPAIGADGNPVNVTGNKVRTRAHAIAFSGQSWVKMIITAAAPKDNSGVQIAEIDVHDLSATGNGLPDDTWFFMGDSITAFAYDRAQAEQPSFAALIATAAPSFFPAMINGGIGGEKSSDGLARLQAALALNPDYHFFALGYGTNDAANGQVSTTTFGNNLTMMIQALQAAGRVPILAHIPYAIDGMHNTIPAYNAVIDTLTQTYHLPTGPDFYCWFMAHPDQIMPTASDGVTTDGIHPTPVGRVAMNKLWSDAVQAAGAYR